MANDQFEKILQKHHSKIIIILFVDDECEYCIEYSNYVKEIIQDDKFRSKSHLILIDQFDEPFDQYSDMIKNKVPSILFLFKDKILFKKIGVLGRKDFTNFLTKFVTDCF